MKTIPVTCVISGKKNIFNTDYFNSKAIKFNGKDNLLKYYITSEVKKLAEKGLNVGEIRKIIGSSSDIEVTVEYYNEIKRHNNIENRINNFVPLSVFSCFETDDEVKNFLKQL
jgi:hypothetical protein